MRSLTKEAFENESKPLPGEEKQLKVKGRNLDQGGLS